MKTLMHHSINVANFRKEWNDFDALLKSKAQLDERQDILPFFKKHLDLSILICNYFPKIKTPNKLAYEYEIYGDFIADLVVGDSSVHHYGMTKIS